MIDVVIAARNEARMLGACLDAIRRDARDIDISITVVDNGSTDDTAAVAAAHGARVLDESRRGAAAARNRGVAAGSAPLIALLDAHCVVEPGWLRAMAAKFDDPATGACQGRLVHRGIDAAVDAYVRSARRFEHDAILDDTVHGRFNLYPWVLTGNTMLRRRVLERVGSFDPALLACEDVDLGWRMMMDGFHLVSAEDAIATHWDPSSRHGMFAKNWRYGRAAAQLAQAWSAHGARRTLRPRALLARSAVETTVRFCYAGGHWTESLALALRLSRPLAPRPVAPVPLERRPSFAWTDSVTLRISPRVVFWSARDEHVVVDIAARTRFVLERVSSAIWQAIVNGNPRRSVVDSLVSTYGIHPRSGEADVDEFIDELVGAGILERQISLGP